MRRDLYAGALMVLLGGSCILLDTAFGFAAATFFAVLISVPDRRTTLIGSVALAAGLTLAGDAVLTALLKIPFQFFHVF